jgi:hypothetical protein
MGAGTGSGIVSLCARGPSWSSFRRWNCGRTEQWCYPIFPIVVVAHSVLSLATVFTVVCLVQFCLALACSNSN